MTDRAVPYPPGKLTDRFLSVVIPTYNETERLPQTLREIAPYLADRFSRHEIVVVDDNSPDGTAAAVEALRGEIPGIRVLVQPGRLGKGAAVRRGCLEARGDYILFMDADHATPIWELDGFVPLLEESGEGAVVGVRTYQESESRRRRIIGLCAQLLAHLVVFRKPVLDSQCGFKLFTREVVEQVFPRCRVDGGMIDVELFFLMHQSGIPCRYRPVQWENKPGSRIRVIRCMIGDPVEMFKIRLRDWLGVYRRPLAEARQPWGPGAERAAPLPCPALRADSEETPGRRAA
jgi:dolichyl-phosphate beta-glucosyltransferase